MYSKWGRLGKVSEETETQVSYCEQKLALRATSSRLHWGGAAALFYFSDTVWQKWDRWTLRVNVIVVASDPDESEIKETAD